MTSTNETASKERASQPWLTAGVLVALIPFAGYVTAFLYEYGFTSHFKIPAQFITLDWTTVLIAVAAVLFVLVVVFGLLELISPFFLPPKGAIQVALLRTVVVSVAFCVPNAFLARGWLWVVVPVVPALWAIREFLLPYIFYRGSYVERLELAQKRGRDRGHDERGLLARLPRNAFLLLVILAWVCWLAYSMGTSSASGQKEFLVVNTSPEAVVLRSYHDHLVCAYFDRESKEVERSFFVLDTASGPEFILTREDIGPLRVKDD